MKKLPFSLLSLSLLALATLPSVSFASGAVTLGAADSFAVLAGSSITDTTPSVISGDVGLSPAVGTDYLVPVLTTGEVTGTIYAVDATGPAGGLGNNPALLTSAKGALDTAYSFAQTQTPTTTYAPIHDLGGAILSPGTYNDPSSFAVTGTLTLDGGGDPNAVFIFQAGSTLTTASASHIALTGGTQACNVFWQVGSSATLGTGSDFKGSILAFSSITDNGGSTIAGRLLVRGAAVTLNNTHITKPTCATPPASNSFISGSNAPLPFIDIVKTPSPSALPGGPGSVTYTYGVTNAGTVSLYGVWVTDDKCSPVNFISGDTNTDGLLDVKEKWIYSCTKIVSQTETNIATAHGAANGWDAYNTATRAVIVGVITPPVSPASPVSSVAVALMPFVAPQVSQAVSPTLPKTGFSPDHTNSNLEANSFFNSDSQSLIGNIFTLLVSNNFSLDGHTTTSVGLPIRLEIPAIHVDAVVDSVGRTPLGAMDTPKDPASVAWYDLGPRPGQSGDAVIDGHSGWENNVPAVFDHLDTLAVGDKIYVQDGNGATNTFIVRQVAVYKESADASLIFHSTDGKAHLNLITCAGTWNAVTKNSSDRLVVFTDLE